jgi:hypothetical protein
VGGIDNDLVTFANWNTNSGLNVNFNANEAGTYSYGVDGAGSFSEIEEVWASINNDSVNAFATTNGIKIEGGAGDDTLIGGSVNDALGAESGLIPSRVVPATMISGAIAATTRSSAASAMTALAATTGETQFMVE